MYFCKPFYKCLLYLCELQHSIVNIQPFLNSQYSFHKGEKQDFKRLNNLAKIIWKHKWQNLEFNISGFTIHVFKLLKMYIFKSVLSRFSILYNKKPQYWPESDSWETEYNAIKLLLECSAFDGQLVVIKFQRRVNKNISDINIYSRVFTFFFS